MQYIARPMMQKYALKKIIKKVITIPPYRSQFNKIDKSIEEIKKDVIKILEGEELKNTLIKLYKEALLKYKDYYLKNEKNDYNGIVNENGSNEMNLKEN